jgi:hypothetical protein
VDSVCTDSRVFGGAEGGVEVAGEDVEVNEREGEEGEAACRSTMR